MTAPEPPRAAKPAILIPSPTAPGQDGRLPRILVVEDESIVAAAIAKDLRKAGYAVSGTVATGEDALSEAERARPDLVLMDIRLKGDMDGVEAAGRIRERLEIPVVYLTAYSDEETIQRAAGTLPYSYIVKPYEERELRAAVEIGLRHSALERARKEAEDALRQSRHFLQDVIDTAGTPICIKDTAGRYVLVNRQFEELHGLGREALAGKREDELPDPLPAAMHDAEFLAQGAPVRQEVTVAAGHAGRTYLVLRSPLREAPSGRPYAVSVVWFDVTDLKEAQAELGRFNQMLEARVQERTQELLLTMQELEAFTDYVAHDLRAPVRGIRLLAGTLREDYGSRLNTSGNEILARMEADAGRLADLIGALLTFSRAGRMEVRRERVDLSAMVEEALAELRRQHPGRRVAASVAPAVVASGDPTLLRIAVDNLVGNAWKYTAREPEARVEFGVVPPARPGEPETYYVRDNGVGFDMSHRERLFQPFQRLHAASEFNGTGLGLSSVRRVIARHGGDIRAEGAPGAGATFYFRLGAPSSSAPGGVPSP